MDSQTCTTSNRQLCANTGCVEMTYRERAPIGMDVEKESSKSVLSAHLDNDNPDSKVCHTHTHAHTHIYIYIYMCVCVHGLIIRRGP